MDSMPIDVGKSYGNGLLTNRSRLRVGCCNRRSYFTHCFVVALKSFCLSCQTSVSSMSSPAMFPKIFATYKLPLLLYLLGKYTNATSALLLRKRSHPRP